VFGGTRSESIRPRDVAGYVRQVMSEPQHERFGRPLSAKFVNLHLNVLHNIFKTAIAEELVQTNPVASVERPKVQRRRWRILQPAEVGWVAAGFTDERGRRVFLTLNADGTAPVRVAGVALAGREHVRARSPSRRYARRVRHRKGPRC